MADEPKRNKYILIVAIVGTVISLFTLGFCVLYMLKDYANEKVNK